MMTAQRKQAPEATSATKGVIGASDRPDTAGGLFNRRIIAALFFLAIACRADEAFRYRVERDKLLRDERGELRIDTAGVSYKSDNGETTIQIPLIDVREADVSDRHAIRIETYDIIKRKLAGRRRFSFRLLDGTHDDQLTRFLVQNLRRPVIGAYGAPEPSAGSIAAYHRHRLGGCHGSLQISSTGVGFRGDTPSESRTWLYSEIETVGSMNPFHFRVTTLGETFNFDLKERLPEQLYDLVMRSVYRLSSRKPA